MIDCIFKGGEQGEKFTQNCKYVNSRIFQNSIVFLGVFILVIILGKNIINASTVWELSDEAGYLSNTAYFLGYDWNDVRAIMPYYAYGYSVFLIPVFLLANTGVQLIRGAMCINLIFTVGTYLIIVYLLEKVGKQKNRIFTSTIALITCLNSYLCCNVIKIFCESLATFWYCLITLILFKAIEKKRWYYFVLLGLTSSYLFYIHTRMVVLVFALILTLAIILLFLDKKHYMVKLLFFTTTFLISFIILYFVKQSIVHSAAVLSTSDITQVNLINKKYILDRISGMFTLENLRFYLLSFLSKIYYVIISSAGTIMFGYTCLCRSLFPIQSKKEDIPSFAVKVFLLLGMTLMIVVCTLNGAGNLNDFTYFFYSRYYENTVVPMTAFSLLGLITTKWENKLFFIFMALEVSMGIVVATLKNYLYSDGIRMDTNRIPGFSWIVKNADNFQNMILWGTVIIVLAYIIYFFSNKLKYKAFIVLVVVFFLTWNSSTLGIKEINDVNKRAKPDAEIAEYIMNNSNSNIVYMIDDDSYRYSRYYCRMQVLLKDISLKVIHSEELDKIDSIQNGAWVLTYRETFLRDTYLSDMENVMSGAVFELWRK